MYLNPRWRKVLRDIWDNKTRTILVVLAIAVGVFAFGGVFITQDVLLTEMNVGYRSINPASIIMNLSSFDDSVVQSVKAMRSVTNAEGRITYSVKVLSRSGEWLNIDIYAVDDYENMQINRITLEQGTWPPQRRQILLERTAVPLLDAQIGDKLVIELADGRQRELELAGIVHDFNAVPANLFPQLTGFTSVETLRWLGHPGTYDTLNITTQESITDLEEIEEIGGDIKNRLELDGYSVYFVQAQDPGQHWAADVTKAFTAVLSGIGMLSLVLSGFLVVNTISAVIAQQKRQVGMMKAVGARHGQVIGVYMTMVAVFGVLSLVVALPVGVVLAWANTMIIARFLNLNIVNFHIPAWIFGLQIVTALIAPLVAGLVPILNGTRVTVREAVSDYGIGMRTRFGAFDRMLAQIRGLPRPTLLSLRNTFRRKGRLYLTLTTLTLAGAIFIAVLSVRESLLIELDKILLLFNYDVQLALDAPYPVSRLEREAVRVPGVTRVEGWAFAQVYRIRPDGVEGPTFTLFGPPADTPFIQPTLEDGRWLEPGDQNAIVLGSEVLRDEPDIKVGDEIVLKLDEMKRKWQVVGIISLPGVDFAYANFDYLSRIQGAPGQSFVLISGTERHDGAFQAKVGRDLEERLKRSGIGVSQLLTTQTIVGANVSQFNFLIGFMLFMAVLLAVVGGLGLAGTMSLNVLERTREIGVMRAIGASNGSVSSIVLVEGLLIGLLSWALGSVLSIPVSIGLSTAVGLAFFERPMDFSFSMLGVLAWLVLALFIAALASLLPARRASSVSVREALAYE